MLNWHNQRVAIERELDYNRLYGRPHTENKSLRYIGTRRGEEEEGVGGGSLDIQPGRQCTLRCA